jgi:hypothetical protein
MLRPAETAAQMTSDAVGHSGHAIGHIVKIPRAWVVMRFIGTSFGDFFGRHFVQFDCDLL